jgi:hypothetical protein
MSSSRKDGVITHVQRLTHEVVDEMRGTGAEFGAVLAQLSAALARVEDSSEEQLAGALKEQVALLTIKIEEERRSHLIREGELEDKMCETKIRMYQYRDESLQSLLGLDTMAELEDIICAIKAQQRESRSLRQLQMDARRQALEDSESMVKLLTGCRVFEMDLENMLRRVVERRGKEDSDPKALENHLSRALVEFQKGFGSQRERATMLLAFQSRERARDAVISRQRSHADEPGSSSARSTGARGGRAELNWGKSASERNQDAQPSTPILASGIRSGAQTPLWSASSANSPTHSRAASRQPSRQTSPLHLRTDRAERECQGSGNMSMSSPSTPAAALTKKIDLFGKPSPP